MPPSPVIGSTSIATTSLLFSATTRTASRSLYGTRLKPVTSGSTPARVLPGPGGRLGLKRHLRPVGGVQQFAGLVADRLRDLGVGVAKPAHGDPGQRIEIFAALRVREPGARTVRERHGQGGEYRHLIVRWHLLITKNTKAPCLRAPLSLWEKF